MSLPSRLISRIWPVSQKPSSSFSVISCLVSEGSTSVFTTKSSACCKTPSDQGFCYSWAVKCLFCFNVEWVYPVSFLLLVLGAFSFFINLTIGLLILLVISKNQVLALLSSLLHAFVFINFYSLFLHWLLFHVLSLASCSCTDQRCAEYLRRLFSHQSSDTHQVSSSSVQFWH